jgi:anti-sigma regulatory factor (Ser/Thr protein kinase)
MARLDLNALTLHITVAAVQHPHDLATHVAQSAGVSRSTAQKALQRLAQLGWLAREGTARRPHFKPGLLRQVVRRYPLAGLQEDLPWSRDFAPFLALPTEVQRMTQHAFGELLNNAIDHSGGTSVTVSLRQTPSHMQLLVSDDGCGVFDQLSRSFSLDDPAIAMLELSKGKLTSQPARHAGRGLFFTSRLADVFDLHANETAFQHRVWEGNGWRPGRALKHTGTSVYAAIALDTARTLESVLHAHSLSGEGFGFERTVVPLRLMATPLSGLDSRAQARRVAARLGAFRRAEMDFEGISAIGHSFADELFRVMSPELAEVDLVPLNMSPTVAAMIDSVRDGR